jgi:GMP synthase (glutamine-hydrolysing)
VLRAMNVKGIILSGGPFSVYEEGAPHLDPAVWALAAEKRIPVLGICYGFQEMAHSLGGKVEKAPHREFGHAEVSDGSGGGGGGGAGAPARSDLLRGLSNPLRVWMSHGDKVVELPKWFRKVAATPDCEFAVAEGAVDATGAEGYPNRMFGMQFHPEVEHTPEGKALLRNFVVDVCRVEETWSMASFMEGALSAGKVCHVRHTVPSFPPPPPSPTPPLTRHSLPPADAIAGIRAAVGDKKVIGAVSGGVDSTVAAVLMAKAIGANFHAIMVDNGLLRKNERVDVLKRLNEVGVNLRAVDASERFLTKLAGVSDPEAKRKIIGAEFIHVFQEEAAALGAQFEFLMQGTLFPDVIESVSFKGPSATIKSHHNVGGLLATMKLKLVEPLRELFKDEVRALGVEQLGLDRDVVFRHPFPGPGLAIRILGDVTREACDVLREADAIYLEELRRAGEYDKIGQAFAVLLPCKSVGVMGDGRTYEKVLALRAVGTSDFMTADWHKMPYEVLARVSTRIINEVRGINRVVYDVSTKPPATIE